MGLAERIVPIRATHLDVPLQSNKYLDVPLQSNKYLADTSLAHLSDMSSTASNCGKSDSLLVC